MAQSNELSTSQERPAPIRNGRRADRRLSHGLLQSSAIGIALAALLALPGIASAAGGTGGNGFTGASGGTGGSGPDGGAGGTGDISVNSGGGGGGGGAGSGASNGGQGGTGGNSGSTGGAGGTSGSPIGGAGGNSNGNGGAGGGGGGYSAIAIGTLTNTLTLTGGTGGAGGAQTNVNANGGGGGGGEGGYGAVVTGGGGGHSNAATITGGAGGSGGNSLGAAGGSGGSGGVGVFFAAPGASFLNSGTITGGTGGSNGSGHPARGPGSVGAGGVGIVGSSLTLTNNGTISGGLSGSGARADAISFGGGSNVLFLSSGGVTGTIIGDIAFSGSLGLNPGTPGAVTLGNVLKGGGSLAKDGSGTLTLSGTNTYSGGTIINSGVLSISSDANLGDAAGAVTFGGSSTLQLTGDLSSARDVTLNAIGTFEVAAGVSTEWSGSFSGIGSVTKTGAGTLILSGANTYLPGTSILGGTLAVTQAGLGNTTSIDLDGGTLQALEDIAAPSVNVGLAGGTIDTDVYSVGVFGGTSFLGELTKTGSGTLFLYDTGIGSGGVNVAAGTLGLGSDDAAGDGLIKLADGTTLMDCGCGISLLNNIEVAATGTATLDANGSTFSPFTLNGVISGGNVNFVSSAGQGVLMLTGANSYRDTLIRENALVVLSGNGTLGSGNLAFDPAATDPMTQGLGFLNDADYTFGGTISGAGFISVQTADPATTITLSGSSTNFTGIVALLSGKLVIDGALGDVAGNTAQMLVDDYGCGCGASATLGGSGTFYGSIDVGVIGGGALNVGNSPGTLTIAGNLNLGSGTILNFELNEPSAVGGANNDLINVGGLLTLDGTLNTIAWGPNYGPGYYRLFNYGTLQDNGLAIGSIAGSGLTASVLTNIDHQVNLLLNGGAQVVQYWDGADTTGASNAATGDGGAGTWTGTSTNWTAPTGYAINDVWRIQVGVFAGAVGGTVTVEGEQAFQELRFQTNGYTLAPGNNAKLMTTGGFSVVDVSSGISANIGVGIYGTAGVTKTGAGTLILSAVNAYSGATEIMGGTLQMGIDNAISSASGVTVAAGATFALNGFDAQIGSFAGAGAVTLGGGGSELRFGTDSTSTVFSGTMTGNGNARKNGNGTFTLTGSINLSDGDPNAYTTFAIDSGTMDVGAGGTLTADIIQNFATLTNTTGTITANDSFQNFGTFTNDGQLSGTNQNFGTFTNNALMGGLSNISGTATNAGTINGSVSNFASFTSTGTIQGSLSNFGTALLQGQLNGILGNLQNTATATLTGVLIGVTSYQGATGSTLDLAGFATTIGGLNGDGSIVTGGAALTVGDVSDWNFFGVISGSGSLTKVGTGTQTLSGVNTYTGLTTVSGGTLEVGLGGSLAGAVTNNATFNNNGTVGGLLTNSGSANNTGTLAAGVINAVGGSLTSNGTIAVGLQNAGSALLSGQVNGFISNSGTINLGGDLTGVTAFSQTSGAFFNVGVYSTSVDSLNGAGTITLGGGSFGVTGGGASVFSGAFSGIGSLTKDGAGTLSLTGSSDFTGTATVNAGTLAIGTTGAFAGAVVNNATFQNQGTSSGGLTNNAGASATNTGTLAGGVTNNGTFVSTGTLTGNLTNSGSATISGALNGNVNVLAGTVTLSGTTTGINDVGTAAGGTFNVNGFATAANSLSGTGGSIDLGAATLTVGGNGASSAYGGVISNTGSITKVGGGTLTLTGANTYTGLTTVSGGTLSIAAGGGLAGIVLNNATFTNAGMVNGQLFNNATASNTGTLAGGVGNASGGTFTSSGVIAIGLQNAGSATLSGQLNGFLSNSGTVTLAGNLTGITAFTQLGGAFNVGTYATAVDSLNGDGTIALNGGSFGVTGGGNSSFSGGFTGAGSLTKSGAGTLSLGGASSFTGTATVDGGLLSINVAGSFAGAVVNNALFENYGLAGGGLTNNAGATAANFGTLSGGLINNVGAAASNSGTLNGDVNNSGLFNSNGTINGNLINRGSATISGPLNGDVDVQAGLVSVFGSVTGIGNVNTAAGGTFYLANGDVAINSLSGTEGTVNLGSATLTVGANGASSTYGGVFGSGGPGRLTKVGAGTLTLSGVSTNTGLTTVSGGTLVLTSSGRLAGAVLNNATFSNAGTVSGLLTNNATTTNSGTLASGVVNASGASLTSTGSIGVGVQNAGSATLSGQLNGFLSNSGTVNLAGNLLGLTAFTQTSDGVFNLGAFGASVTSLNGAGAIQLASGSFTVNGTGTFSGVISGSGTFTKSGAGNLVLTGANIFTGTTTVNSGTLQIASTGSFVGPVIVNASFRNDGTMSGALTIASSGAAANFGSMTGPIANSGAFGNIAGGTVTALLTNTSSGTATNYGTMTGGVVNDGYFFSLDAVVSGGLTNRGTAQVSGQLNGTVDNLAGIFALGGTTTGIGRLTMSPGAAFDLAGFDTVIGSLSGTGGIVRLAGAVLTMGGDNSDSAYGGNITGAGASGLTKTGTGTMILSGASTYAGTTTVAAGVLNVRNATALGATTGGTIVQAGAALELQGGITIGAEALTLSGTGIANGGALRSVSGINVFEGNIALGSDVRINSDDRNGRLAVAGTLNGNGHALVVGGAGVTVFRNALSNLTSLTVDGYITTLRGVNTYTGPTIVTAGFLQLVGGQAIADTGAVVVNTGAVLQVFDTETIGSLAGSGEVLMTGDMSPAIGLTAGGDNSSTLFSGAFNQERGAIGSLTKTGTGTLTLSGALGYTGVTTVSGGTLVLTATSQAAGDVVNNATLAASGIIAGNVTNNGTAQLANGIGGNLANTGAATLTGNLSVIGRLTQAAGGSFNLAGFSAGLGSLEGAGTVQLGSGMIAAGFDNSSSTFAGVISGTGSLTKTGTGTLILTAINAYTGTTFVNAGTLVIGDGQTSLAAPTIALAAPAAADAPAGRLAAAERSRSPAIVALGSAEAAPAAAVPEAVVDTVQAAPHALSPAVIAGDVVNAATLINNGTILGQLANNAGAAAVNNGVIGGAVFNSGTFTSTGTLSGGLSNTGTARIAGILTGDVINAGGITLTGLTTGIATFQQAAGGSLALAGFDTSIGVLSGAGTASLGSARLTTGTNGVDSLFAGVISGAGALTKVGTGRLVLTGDNTYAGGTTIAAGTLQVGNGGTTGSILGAIVNNGAIAINRSDAVTLANLISGTGIFVQAGTGTTTLTGANTYSGGTLISAGRLVGSTASLQGLIEDNAALEFAQAANGVFAGRLFGTGTLDKSGAGLLELTGDNSGLRGATTVRAGELRVTGNLNSSSVTLLSGTTLSGTGTVGGLVAQSGAVVSAGGNALGGLGVNGNIQLLAGSSLLTQLQGGAGGGADALVGNGTAQIGGAITFANLGGLYAFNTNIVIVQASGGLTGTFSGINGLASFGAMYRPELVYTATQAMVRMAPNIVSAIVGTTPLTPNQTSVVSRIDGAVLNGGFNPTPLLALYLLAPAQLPAALDQLSGEAYATAANAGIEQDRLVREAVLSRLSDMAATARAEPEHAVGGAVWGQMVGSWGDTEGDGNASAFDMRREGYVTGIDYGNADGGGSWRVGVFGQYLKTRIEIAGLGSTAEVEATGGGVYGGVTAGRINAAFGASFANIDLSATRTIAFTGFGEVARGMSEGEAYQGFVEVSYEIPSGDWILRPFVNAHVGSFELDGLREVGGVAALSIGEQSYTTTTATIGLNAAADLGDVHLSGTFGGRVQLGDRGPNAAIALAAAPSQAFGIEGIQLDDFAITARLDATMRINDGIDLSLGYTGLVGAATSDHGARVTLGVRF
ncbi:hypothetical protein sos41_36040 [Alphaproteobacteria bacterium SO-S41]|nr:hypothetical protein sos41_36040 [Alphaproteobacteria bacterium SO-S41]